MGGVLAWQLVVFQVLDLGLTWHGLASGHMAELNPNGRLLLEGGFVALVPAKVVATVGFLGIMAYLHRSCSRKVALVGMWWGWSLMLAVVTWNALQLTVAS